MNLKNKVVVITGASKGLGKEVVLKLCEEKVKFALVARSEKELSKLKEIAKKKGCESEYFVCDIANDEEVFSTVKNIIKKFGRIDILINNAGIWFEGPLESHTPEKVREVFDVVTLGTIFFTLAVVPYMKKQKSGQIFNVVSITGIEAPRKENGQYSVYTSAKFAIRGFTEALEEELKGTGIKVMGFYPAGMNTEIFKTAGFKYKNNEDWMMEKKEVAEIIVFILNSPKGLIMDHVVVRKFN